MAKINLDIEIQGAYDVDQAAGKLDVGVATIWRWIKKGKLSSFKVTVGTHTRTLILAKEVEQIKAESSQGKELSRAR